jgi:hypothetical protein
MDIEHQRLLARIRNHEDEKQIEPDDKISIATQISSFIEATNEYIEDSKKILARNEVGKLVRLSLKITLGYKAGSYSAGGVYKNILVQL